MSLFVQLLLNGLVSGSLYALVAVGFALIFGATKHFHISHAAVFASGGYLTYLFGTWLNLPAPLAAAAGIAIAVSLGVAIVRFLYVPLNRRGGQGFILFLVSLGVLTVLDNIFTIGLGAQPAKPDLGGWFSTARTMGPWTLTFGQIAIIVLTFVMFAGLVVALERTRAGKLIKAYSGNPEFFEVFGRKPLVVLTLVYAVGSLFAAVAGTYIAADIGMQPGLGEQYFIVAIMAVFIGGIGSIRGAFIAAMLLGVLQSLLLLWMGAQWTLAAVFLAFLILITASPEGLQAIKFTTRKRSLA
jgi:branched-chain amino acid transport system permease protein